jgi:hypothetical protein
MTISSTSLSSYTSCSWFLKLYLSIVWSKLEECGCKSLNMVQILYTHVCKCKNETCWNYSRNGRRGEKRKMVTYCKNFCKCHNVPPPSTTVKKSRRMWRCMKRKLISFLPSPTPPTKINNLLLIDHSSPYAHWSQGWIAGCRKAIDTCFSSSSGSLIVIVGCLGWMLRSMPRQCAYVVDEHKGGSVISAMAVG